MSIDTSTVNWPRIGGHSLTIGGYHLFSDLGLVCREIPVIQPPPLKSQVIDLPGADGALDLSEAVSGKPVYGNRTGSLRFYALHGQSYQSAYASVLRKLHGKELRMVLDDDPLYYYEGRWTVNQWASREYASEIVLDYDLKPYRYSLAGTGAQDWLWNDLFGLIIYYGTFDVAGSVVRTLINPSGTTLTPEITCSAAMSVTYGGDTYALPKGRSRQITIVPGDNEMVFTGTGRVNIDYATAKAL